MIIKKRLFTNLLILFVFVFIFSNIINGQILSYNEVKKKGILLESNLNTHQFYIITGSLSSDYLFCDIYIFGKYYLNFSKVDYGKLIFQDQYSKVFIQFATYKKNFNQNEKLQYLETFQIRITIDDLKKIVLDKDKNIFLHFVGNYGEISCQLTKKFIRVIEKLSFDNDTDYNSYNNINIRSYKFFTNFYCFNFYYYFDNSNIAINDYAFIPFNSDNFAIEVGLYFKIPYLSAISI